MKKDLEKVWSGRPVGHLIMSTNEFIVFLDKDYDLDWETIDKHTHKDENKNNEVLNEAALVESTPAAHLDKEIRLKFKRLIGEGIARSLQGDYNNALKIVRRAQEFVNDRNNEKSRYWFLKATGISTFLVSAVGAIAWCLRSLMIQVLGDFVFYLLLASAAGSMGAFLSVTMRMGKSQLNCAAGEKLHYLEGSFRVAAGMVSAALVALAVKTGIIVPLFSKLHATHAAMVLAGFAAGASERLAPSIISGIDGSKRASRKQDAKAGHPLGHEE